MRSILLAINLLALFAIAPSAWCGETSGPMVAVASNFTGAMEKIVAAYEKESGVEVRTVYSSTGKFYAQIRMGAPYDIFLAADEKRPELLAEEGMCEAPFVYATGEAVLWTKKSSLADKNTWREAIVAESLERIAISTPETAPYGASAMAALEEEGLLPGIENKLVYGQNVAQSFQFAYHGSADLSFTALSLALSAKGREGRYWPIRSAPPVVQKGCVVKNAANREAIGLFLDFFRSESGRAVLREFGYNLNP